MRGGNTMIMKVEQKHIDKAYEVLEKIVTRHSMEPVQGTHVYNDITHPAKLNFTLS